MNPFGTSTSASDLITSVASSTSGYLGNFAPIFEVMAGIILAFTLVAFLVSVVFHRGAAAPLDLDDIMPDI